MRVRGRKIAGACLAAGLGVVTLAAAQTRSLAGPTIAGYGPAAARIATQPIGPTTTSSTTSTLTAPPTTVTTSSTTTSTTGTTLPAPSWVSATVAAWMLDEGPGTRVNA